MPEDFSIPRVLPIGTIFFEVLFLLIAIPIEAYVLHKWLKFDKKTSVFYAIAMNVFSSVIGWNIFFLVEPILPVQIKSELISYVLFNNFKLATTQSLIIFTGAVIFFGTFLIKFILLKLLLISLDEGGKKPEPTMTTQRDRWRHNSKAKLQNTNLVTTTLIANSLSYSAIALILFIRSR